MNGSKSGKTPTITAAVLVVSDRVASGLMEDQSGREAKETLKSFAEVVETAVVPDDFTAIRKHFIDWCDRGIDLIFSIGGTGLSPRDVTPEATKSVIEREVPGLSIALLLNGLKTTPRAMLSRAVAGVRGKSIIINLPGSSSAVKGSIEYLKDVLPHAISVVGGGGSDEHVNE